MTADSIRTALLVIAAEIERGNHRSAADKVAALVSALPPATDAEVAALRAELAAAKAEIAARDEIARLRAMSTETLIDLHARRLCESAGFDWSRASGSERDAWAAEVHGALARLRYDDAAAIVIGMAPATPATVGELPAATTARHISEWHEDRGAALWWRFPIDEPPYCGSPLDDDWPGYHAHWTPIVCPDDPATRGPIGAPNQHPDGCHAIDAKAPRDCTGDGHYECATCSRLDRAGRAANGDPPIGGDAKVSCADPFGCDPAYPCFGDPAKCSKRPIGGGR